MTNLKMILLCTYTNFRKWPVNPRIYTLALVIVAFLAYHSFGLSQFSADKEVGITPWVFPHLTTPPVMQVFACLTVLLFCDAPFVDRHMPFLLIRVGRRNWTIGQLLYIVFTSFIYTTFVAAVSILVLIPNVQFTSNWGLLINSLGANSVIVPDSVTVFVSGEIITMFSAMEAMLISCGLFWLVSIFIGVLIFYFNVCFGKMSGIIAAGGFIFLSFFSMNHGRLLIGDWLLYITPISWMNMSYINFKYSEISAILPSPTYVVFVLLGAILLMSCISVKVFCKKDIDIQEWGY